MLELIEKFTAGTCLALVALTLAVYLFLGSPGTTSAEFIPSVQEVRTPPPPARRTEDPPSPEEKAILDQLLLQGRRLAPGQHLATRESQVPVKLFEHVRSKANMLQEVNKAESALLEVAGRPTRLQLFNIDQDSAFSKLGLQDNDVIELVDGKILEFRETKSAEFVSLFEDALDRLSRGEEISVTVSRNNQPVHLKFRL